MTSNSKRNKMLKWREDFVYLPNLDCNHKLRLMRKQKKMFVQPSALALDWKVWVGWKRYQSKSDLWKQKIHPSLQKCGFQYHHTQHYSQLKQKIRKSWELGRKKQQTSTSDFWTFFFRIDLDLKKKLSLKSGWNKSLFNQQTLGNESIGLQKDPSTNFGTLFFAPVEGNMRNNVMELHLLNII